MFVFNDTNGACFSDYTYNPRFEHIDDSLLLRLPLKFLHLLKYVGICKATCSVGNNPVLSAVVFQQCNGMFLRKTAVQGRLFFYVFLTSVSYGLGEEWVPDTNWLREIDSSPTTASLTLFQ